SPRSCAVRQMAIVADSGAIYALYDKRDSTHAAVRAVVEEERDRIYVPSVILGEIDYFLRGRIGTNGVLRFLTDLANRAFLIEEFTVDDVQRCGEILVKYADLNLGLCDASVVATAERLETDTILTVDVRDFRVIRTAQGRAFRLLPADRKKR